MGMKRPAFTSTRLEEERSQDKSTTLNVRLNQEEQAIVEELKEIFDTDQDGAALKLAAKVGLKVLHNTFSAEDLRWLFKKDRSRRAP